MRSAVTTAAHAVIILLRAEVTLMMAAAMAVGKITGHQHAATRSEASAMRTGTTALMTALSAGETRRSEELTAVAGPETQSGTASIITAAVTVMRIGIAAIPAMSTRMGARMLRITVLRTAKLQLRRGRVRCIAAVGRLRRARTRGMVSATVPMASSALEIAGPFKKLLLSQGAFSSMALCLSLTCDTTSLGRFDMQQQADAWRSGMSCRAVSAVISLVIPCAQ